MKQAGHTNIVISITALLLIYGLTRNFSAGPPPHEKQQRDSTVLSLQSAVDSLYPDVQRYTDLCARKDELQLQAEACKQNIRLIDDTLKILNNTSLEEICASLGNKKTEAKAREQLKLLYTNIFLAEKERRDELDKIREAEDLLQNIEHAIKKAEPSYRKSKNAILSLASKMLGPGEIEIKKSKYRFYVAGLGTDAVYIHNNNKKRGGQSIKEIINLLGKEKKEPLMITNGGMYTPDFAAQGLLVENYREMQELDTLKPDNKGNLNFYLQPNGVFYIDSTGFYISTTDEYCESYSVSKKPRFATQSGPMLIHNGKRNSRFRNGSTNTNIRSGVGAISRDKVVFVISDARVNFYDFAAVFDDIFNCKNALYLDGAISRMYITGQDARSGAPGDENFGPMISITKIKK